MRAAKHLLASATIALAALAIHSLCVVPYRQNVLKKAVEAEITRFFVDGTGPSDFATAARVRGDITELRRALRSSPTDPDLFMELAAAYRVIGAYDDAIATYRSMLRYHRRPEIYINIGDMLFSRNDFAAATENYAYAVAFDKEELNLVPNVLYWPVHDRALILRASISNS